MGIPLRTKVSLSLIHLYKMKHPLNKEYSQKPVPGSKSTMGLLNIWFDTVLDNEVSKRLYVLKNILFIVRYICICALVHPLSSMYAGHDLLFFLEGAASSYFLEPVVTTSHLERACPMGH